MYKFFGSILNFFNSWTGNYMVALLLFALAIKIVLLPLAIMQQKNQIKGAKLRPKILMIEKKYAGRNDQPTLRRKQEEIMALQQKEGYSAFSGCLPLLIQLPIILILFRVIQKPLTYVSKIGGYLGAIAEAIGFEGSYSASEISLISAIKGNMDAAQSAFAGAGGEGLLSDVLPKLSFFGDKLDLTLTPVVRGNFSWSLLLLIPVINFAFSLVTMILSKKLNGDPAQMAAQTQDQKTSSGIMMWLGPITAVIFSAMMPGAIGVYWIYQSVIGILQMLILAKVMPMPKYSKAELEQIVKELKKKQVERPAYTGSSYSGDRPRSLHHIDDDDDFPEDNKKPVNNAPKKRSRPAPAPSEKKLKPEDFAAKEETPVDEAPVEETPVEEAPSVETKTVEGDLADMVNAIGADDNADEQKED